MIFPQENATESCQVIEKLVVWRYTPIRDCRLCSHFHNSCQDFALGGNSDPRCVRGSGIDNFRTQHRTEWPRGFGHEPRERLARRVRYPQNEG
jgi:hypothetical protein